MNKIQFENLPEAVSELLEKVSSIEEYLKQGSIQNLQVSPTSGNSLHQKGQEANFPEGRINNLAKDREEENRSRIKGRSREQPNY